MSVRSLRLLIDMNLSPEWVAALAAHGYDAIHWSSVGDPRASDATIMQWARENGRVVFTHDLDFGTLLALTHSSGPSVIQVRSRNLMPDQIEKLVVAALAQYEAALLAGALTIVEETKSRVRVLPL